MRKRERPTTVNEERSRTGGWSSCPTTVSSFFKQDFWFLRILKQVVKVFLRNLLRESFDEEFEQMAYCTFWDPFGFGYRISFQWYPNA